jgi:predicted ArsR family transcriptional regulator
MSEMDESPAQEHSKASGLNLFKLNQLPDSQRQLINWMRRKGDCSLQEIATQIGEHDEAVRTLLDTLLEKGFLRELLGESSPSYRVNIAAKRGRELPLKLKQALEKKKEE